MGISDERGGAMVVERGKERRNDEVAAVLSEVPRSYISSSTVVDGLRNKSKEYDELQRATTLHGSASTIHHGALYGLGFSGSLVHSPAIES